jgi:hypothetical protein
LHRVRILGLGPGAPLQVIGIEAAGGTPTDVKPMVKGPGVKGPGDF